MGCFQSSPSTPNNNTDNTNTPPIIPPPPPQIPNVDPYDDSSKINFIGYIEAEFDNHEVQYGTGFFISQRLFVTCAHNIYNRQRQQQAKSVKIFHKIDKKNDLQLKKANSLQVKKPYLIPKEYMINLPNNQTNDERIKFMVKKIYPYDFSVLRIQELTKEQKQRYEKRAYSLIPYFYQHQSKIQKKLQNLKVFGYDPAKKIPQLQEQIGKQQIFPEQQKFEKEIYIHYNNQTMYGFSGGPILIKKGQYSSSQYYLIGIHLQQRILEDDRKTKTGLLFSNRLIDLMIKTISLSNLGQQQIRKDIKSIFKINIPEHRQDGSDQKSLSDLKMVNKVSEVSNSFRDGKVTYQNGHIEKSLAIYHQTKEKIRDKHSEAYGDLMVQIGISYMKLSDYKNALKHLQEAQIIYEYLQVGGQKFTIMKVNLVISKMKCMNSSIEEEKVDLLSHLHSDIANKELLYIKIGYITFQILHKYESSMTFFQGAKKLIKEKTNDFKNMNSKQYSYLGQIYHYQGLLSMKQLKYDTSLQIFFKSADKFQKGGLLLHPDFKEITQMQSQEYQLFIEKTKLVQSAFLQALLYYATKYQLENSLINMIADKIIR